MKMKLHVELILKNKNKNGLALSIALKQRYKRTRKWPISAGAKFSEIKVQKTRVVMFVLD